MADPEEPIGPFEASHVEGESPDDRGGPPGFPYRSALLLIAAAAYLPLTLYGARSFELNRGYRLATLTLAILVGLSAVSWLLRRLGLSARSAVDGVAVWWLASSLSPGGPWGPERGEAFVWLVSSAAVAVIVVKLERLGWFRALIGGVAASMIIVPTLQLAVSDLRRRDPTITAAVSMGPGAATYNGERPDVWFVVLDGYPSGATITDVLASDHGLSDYLDTAGFEVNVNAVSPYGRTMFALPALLQGGVVFDGVGDFARPT